METCARPCEKSYLLECMGILLSIRFCCLDLFTVKKLLEGGFQLGFGDCFAFVFGALAITTRSHSTLRTFWWVKHQTRWKPRPPPLSPANSTRHCEQSL